MEKLFRWPTYLHGLLDRCAPRECLLVLRVGKMDELGKGSFLSHSRFSATELGICLGTLTLEEQKTHFF